MKGFLKFILPGLFVFLFSAELKAQEFPATDKEVGEILCAGKWTLDSVGNDKRMTTSKEAMMDDVMIVFKADGSYTITMFEMDRAGKWKTSMEERRVKIDGKKPGLTQSFIKVKKDKDVGATGFLSQLVSGKEDVYHYVPILSHEQKGDSIIVEKFIDEGVSERQAYQ